MTSAAQLYNTVIITGIKEECPGIKTFTLAAADGKAITYTAGQFLTFVLSHHGREERRSFSISSAPATNEPLSITVKRVDNGIYSRLLHDRGQPGDQLITTGAAGRFVLPASFSSFRQVFFLAAGIGITPIFSLIKTLLLTDASVQAVLIYSNTSPRGTAFRAQLEALALAYPARFKIVFLYSSSFDLSRARLNKELVRTLLKEYVNSLPEQILCYTCGPYAYMRMVSYALEDNGIPADHIKKEHFNSESKPVITATPPDKDRHVVTLSHNGQERQFTCQYPETILKAAHSNGITLPYSCETGRCGSCAAICTAGKVWHSYNEVLTDTELRHGSILTCTGYPIGGDVIIVV